MVVKVKQKKSHMCGIQVAKTMDKFNNHLTPSQYLDGGQVWLLLLTALCIQTVESQQCPPTSDRMLKSQLRWGISPLTLNFRSTQPKM